MDTSVCMLLLLAVFGIASLATGINSQEDEQSNEVLDNLIKRTPNLGARLMCEIDSRNCGPYNRDRKSRGYSQLDSADLIRRRLAVELAKKWQRELEQEQLSLHQNEAFRQQDDI